VDFYDQRQPVTSFLGNFFPAPVTLEINGVWYTFRCAEAAFQAGKFVNYPNLIEELRQFDGPQAHAFGQLNHRFTPGDWIRRGQNIAWMRTVTEAKYRDHFLRQLLLETLDSHLVERPPLGRDGFWGDNGDGSGQNTLGTIIMEERRNITRRAPRLLSPAAYGAIIAGRSAQDYTMPSGSV